MSMDAVTSSTSAAETPGSEFWPTRRQAQVLRQLERGLTNKEIAAALGIRATTVSYHLRQLFSMADVNTRTGLLTWHLRDSGRGRA